MLGNTIEEVTENASAEHDSPEAVVEPREELE